MTDMKIVYEVFETSEHGYRHTHLVIREMYEESLEQLMAACVDNKAGYRSVEIAQRMSRQFREMLDQGYRVRYDSSPYGLYIHLSWQHYKGGPEGALEYCEPRYESLGGSYRLIHKGMAFLTKLGRRVERSREGGRVSNRSFEKPEPLLEILARDKKIAQVRRVMAWNTCVLASEGQIPERQAG